ncbi:MAG: hypothetical protein HQL32_17290 [Planctomycetes bacterium]|nr:hypothetical protein [Planctomycetota bacterium]
MDSLSANEKQISGVEERLLLAVKDSQQAVISPLELRASELHGATEKKILKSLTGIQDENTQRFKHLLDGFKLNEENRRFEHQQFLGYLKLRLKSMERERDQASRQSIPEVLPIISLSIASQAIMLDWTKLSLISPSFKIFLLGILACFIFNLFWELILQREKI